MGQLLPEGNKYGDLVLQIGGVTNKDNTNWIMSPGELGPEKD
jgi:hypothetical protein